MGKILVSDLDGTIYRNKTVASQDMKAINEFTENNELVFATGRNYVTFTRFLERFPLKMSYTILCNGGLIIDRKQAILKSVEFETNAILTILSEVLDTKKINTLSYSFSYQKENYYYPQLTEYELSNFKNALPEKLNSMCLEVNNPSSKDKILKGLSEKINPKDSLQYECNGNYIDIFPQSVSKGQAVLSLYDPKVSELFIIGDGANDISLAKITDNSFGIKYGTPNFLEEVNYIVTSINQAIQQII